MSNVAFERDQPFPPGVTLIVHRDIPVRGATHDPGNQPPYLRPFASRASRQTQAWSPATTGTSW